MMKIFIISPVGIYFFCFAPTQNENLKTNTLSLKIPCIVFFLPLSCRIYFSYFQCLFSMVEYAFAFIDSVNINYWAKYICLFIHLVNRCVSWIFFCGRPFIHSSLSGSSIFHHSFCNPLFKYISSNSLRTQ